MLTIVNTLAPSIEQVSLTLSYTPTIEILLEKGPKKRLISLGRLLYSCDLCAKLLGEVHQCLNRRKFRRVNTINSKFPVVVVPIVSIPPTPAQSIPDRVSNALRDSRADTLEDAPLKANKVLDATAYPISNAASNAGQGAEERRA